MPLDVTDVFSVNNTHDRVSDVTPLMSNWAESVWLFLLPNTSSFNPQFVVWFLFFWITTITLGFDDDMTPVALLECFLPDL